MAPVDEIEQPAQSVHIRTWDTSEAISSLESFVLEDLEPFVTTKFDLDERQYRVLSKKLKIRPRESSLSPRPPWKRSKPVVECLVTLVPHVRFSFFFLGVTYSDFFCRDYSRIISRTPSSRFPHHRSLLQTPDLSPQFYLTPSTPSRNFLTKSSLASRG